MFSAIQQQDQPVSKPSRKKFVFGKFIKVMRSKKYFLINIFLFILCVGVLGFVFLYFMPIMNINNATDNLAHSQFTDQDLQNWVTIVKNSHLIPESDVRSMRTNEIVDYLDGYRQSYQKFNQQNLLKLIPLDWENYTETQLNLSNLNAVTDNQFPDGQIYQGDVGKFEFDRIAEFNLNIDRIVSPVIKQVVAHNIIEDYQGDITGSANSTYLNSLINGAFNDLISALTAQDEQKSLNLILPAEKTDYAKIISISNLGNKLDSLNADSLDLKITDADQLIKVGTLPLLQKLSGFKTSLDVYYRKSDSSYLFGNVFAILGIVPVPVTPTPKPAAQSTDTSVTLTCQNCWLAPVNKINALSSNYAPAVVNTGIAGGGQVTPNTKTALHELSADASSQGINIAVISGYRSYTTQVSTFNSYVQNEIKAGLSHDQAVIKANTYSAKPGHSEHQLGTTTDLKCASCGNFDNSAGNLKLYQYLADNCYKFGFAISYPTNSLELTGYKYEPWHIRYIGKDLAKEFYDSGYLTGNGKYLSQFLENKHLY
jgi:LAS superfamily LD-carboxypeptidase LdcB